MSNELADLYSQGAHETSSFYGSITLFSRDAPFVSKLNKLYEKSPRLKPSIEAGSNEFFLFFIGVDLDTDNFIFMDSMLPYILWEITKNS